MSAIEDLYKEIILDHYRSPRNQGELAEPAHRCEGFNPLCGDELELTMALSDLTVIECKTKVRGCSICQASASMMSEFILSKTIS